MRFVRENSLSLFFGALLLLTLFAQSLVGHSLYNEEAIQHSQETISYPRYLASSHFGEAVMENWESEFLQFTLYILATVWLVQKGSPESKKPGEAGRGTEEEQLLGKHARLAWLGQGRRLANRHLLEFAAALHGSALRRLLVRALVHRLD
jgi:hypothetical protein